ncbi:MAG: hypothetical protein RL148_2526 [Planctomycetota bacterium]|jgi:hypothetical protein
MRILALFACSVLAAQQAPQPAAPAAKQPTFAATVAAHFDAWDADDDLVLSPAEIDRVCVDPAVKDDAAAAIAAIKRVVRAGTYEVPVLSVEGLTKPVKPASGKARAREDADRADSGEQVPAAAPKRVPNFAASFTSGLRRIRTTPRVLFHDDTPDLDACRQGPIGNCWFVASIGAFTHRDPNALRALVTEQEEGYAVHFANGKTLQVTRLTDAELALSGTTGDEGLWLPVLEKAMGQVRQDANPSKYETETATDALAGGSTATVLKLLTGNNTQRIAFHKRVPASKTPPTTPPDPVPADTPDALAQKAHPVLAAATAEKRLVTCSTNTAKHPPGIPGKHAYAVLGYDTAAQVVTVWNPHGRTRKLTGEPGLQNGYAIEKGVFRLPLREFVQVFSSMTWQTATPLPKPEPARPPATKGAGGTEIR